MNTGEIFDGLIQNLKVGDTQAVVGARRDEITKALNKDFRAKDGSTDHCMMVGSYGRHTAIRGVSDLDLLFILPPGLRPNYDDEGGARLVLTRVKDVLRARYPSTEVRVDQCVVRVQFTANRFKFEVQPVFENADGSFAYPDTGADRWKVTKPRAEIVATRECNTRTRSNMRHLARMARAWKNTSGVNMGGLLIDTLVHRFFLETDSYNSAGSDQYGRMARDFFEFLAEEPDKDHYLALGSHQHVKVKAQFHAKARKAYKRCSEAIEEKGQASVAKKWRTVFGTSVPLTAIDKARSYDNTEEFIEDAFPVDIRGSVTIDCEVTQKGFRPSSLFQMLRLGTLLPVDRKLDFKATSCSVHEPYQLKWKVLNRGSEAERRNMVRGQIVDSNQPGVRHERSNFRGDHIVECYVVKDGVVVARDRLRVPIRS